MGAKADALREEMEEAANRVEICRVSVPCSSLQGQWSPGGLSVLFSGVFLKPAGDDPVNENVPGLPTYTSRSMMSSQTQDCEGDQNSESLGTRRCKQRGHGLRVCGEL